MTETHAAPTSPSDREAQGRRVPGRREWLFRGLALSALAALTIWHAPRAAALREARRAEAEGQHVTAVRRALDHLERRPRSREAAAIAARGLSRLDFPTLAEPFYDRSGADDLTSRHARALGLTRGNFRDRAIAAYRGILRDHPGDVLALRRLAGVLISQSRMEEALQVADRLLAIPEGRVLGHTLAGVAHHTAVEPDYDRAASSFEQALELDPQMQEIPLPPAVFWNYLADALIGAGRSGRAAEHLDRALDDLGDDASLLMLLGDAQYEQGDFRGAERAWRRALRLDDRLAAAWGKLGRLDLQRGDAQAALPSLRRATELAPESFEILTNLALALRRLGYDAEADDAQRRADRLRRAAERAARGGPTTSPQP